MSGDLSLHKPKVPPRPGRVQSISSELNSTNEIRRIKSTTVNYMDYSSFGYICSHWAGGAFVDTWRNIESFISLANSLVIAVTSMRSSACATFKAIIGVWQEISKFNENFRLTSAVLYRWINWFWHMLTNFKNRKSGVSPSGCARVREIGEAGNFGEATKWYDIWFWSFTLFVFYLIRKYSLKMLHAVRRACMWAYGLEQHYIAKVLYDFDTHLPDELSVRANQKIRIAPKEKQPKIAMWILASTMDGKNIGLVPMEYIDVVEQRSGEEIKIE